MDLCCIVFKKHKRNGEIIGIVVDTYYIYV